MHRMPVALVMVSTLAATGGALAATTLKIDGVAAGSVQSSEGGDQRAVAVAVTSADGTVTKHIGDLSYAPLVLHLPFPPSAPVLSWIGDVGAGRLTQKTLQLTDVGATSAASTTEFVGAVLVEAQLPALDAASPATGDLKLTVQVEQSRTVTVAANANTARATISSFRLNIAGLDGSGVARIEPLTIRHPLTADQIGEVRSATLNAPVELSNLIVTLSDATSTGWRAWFTDFVVNGRNGDAYEKSGSLEFIDASGRTVGEPLTFGQLGILRLTRINVPNGAAARTQAELYFEKLTAGAASSSGALAANDQPPVSPVPAGGTPPATTTAQRTPLAASAGLPNAAAAGARGVPAAASATATNPADQGSRDPAQFPRVTGLTRLDYSGTFQPGYTTEEASYSTPEGIYQVVPRVDAAAKADGWTMTSLSETNTPNGKTVDEAWSKARTTASLRFLQPPDGSTRITLSMYVQLGQ